MTLPTWYDAGTASVANGSTTVTGTGTLWGGDAIMAGDLVCDLAQPLVPPQRIASVADHGELTLAAPWPGTALVDAAYEIRYVGIIERSTAQSQRLLEQLSVVEANGRGLFYRFGDASADADPGAGYLRVNHADIALSTGGYIDNVDANGGPVAADIDTWDDSTSLVKGKLWLRSIADPSAFHALKITGSVVDGGGYRKLTWTYIGGGGSFSADEELMVFFAATGDRGDGFVTDAEVANPAGLVAYEAEAAGYLVFVTDLGTDFGPLTGISGVVRLIAGPAWELAARYTGTQGIQGDQGDQGWSPRLVIVSDGARRVWQLAGYVGGEGTAPTANVGEYAKGDGTWTAIIGDAADVRGPGGTGTVAEIIAGAGIGVNNADATAPIISAISVTAPQGRLTLQTGVPVMTTDQAGKTTIYYTPFEGSSIPLYNGSEMVPTRFSELSVATTDTTKSPAAIGASKVNDWFIWVDAGTLRLSHGPDWASDTARVLGTALVMVDGIWLNDVAIANGPAASRGTYVGTTRSNASSQLDWIVGGVGTAAVLHVWNMYNRVPVTAFVQDAATAGWSYATAAWRAANANNNNRISFVRGQDHEPVNASYAALGLSTSSGVQLGLSIGVDSTSAPDANSSTATTFFASTSNNQIASMAHYGGYPGFGVHYLQALESGGTNVLFAQNNGLTKGGLFAELLV